MTRVRYAALALLMLITTTTLARGQQNDQPYLGVRTVIGEQGTQVVKVVPGSPAAAAGFRVNDVIIAVDDAVVSTDNPLETILSKLRPGTPAQFTVLRGAERLTILATLGTRQAATLPATALSSDAATLAITTPATSMPATLPAAPTTPAGSGGYLGIRLSGSTQGVNIVEVVPQSPADTAGLKTGDLIVAVDNQSVQRVEQVQAILSHKAPGETVMLRLRRSDVLLEITVQLAPRPDQATAAPVPAIPATPSSFPFGTPHIRMGVNYLVVTPQVAARLNLSVDYGALVTEVIPNSAADFAGIKLNDVITAVEGDKVDAKRTLLFRLLPYNPGDTITLTVVRGSQTLQIPVILTSARGIPAPVT
ncbi:MAG: PDZ domain-containing protein [Anaerolineae bacterium]|nr:PDZ domain-containing protein [Anaerolineae bacterium]